MNRELIPLRDDAHWHSLRAQDLTSTDIAALFGMSPYATAVDVWHAKRDGIVETLEDNERMRWGRRLESVVAEGIAEDQGWSVRPFKEYGRLPEHRLGASFDYRVTTHKVQFMQGDGSFVDGTIDGPDDFVLEIKTVDALAFRSGWTVEPDFIEAPAHIELQIQHQLLVSGLRIGYIGALVGGNTVRLIRREADNDVHAAILQRAAEFWQSVTTGTPPPITTADEARAYVKRQTNVEPGRLFDARGNRAVEELLRDYRLARATAQAATDEADVVKARLLEVIGEAERVMFDGGTISCGYTAGSAGTTITADMIGTTVGARAGFRNFRVNYKKA
jgi:putative phage-type endonuclease